MKLEPKEGYARSISDSEGPLLLGLHTSASARKPRCNVYISAKPLLHEGSSPVFLDGLKKSNEGESQSQLEAQSQCSSRCSIGEVRGAAKDEQGNIGAPTQSQGQGQHPDTNAPRSLPLTRWSITAATGDTAPSFKSQYVPGLRSSMTPTRGILPSSPQSRLTGAGPSANLNAALDANVDNFSRRQRPPNLRLDLSSSQNLKSGRHTSLHAITQPQASTCPGAGIGSFSSSLKTVPTVALDASPASGVWNTYAWTSTPLQSPASLKPAIFTTSTTPSNSSMSMSASPVSATVGRIALEPSMTNEGMSPMGAMPSPFEYPVASPYPSSSPSGMPDGHFDLREMHWSGSGSVVGTAMGHGQGQCHT
jgi:hypothetical protein